MAHRSAKQAEAPTPIDPARAWAPFVPDSRRPWNLAMVGHLYRRAAFGGSWEELQRGLSAGPQRAVEELLRPEADVGAYQRTFDGYEASAAASGSAPALRAWWLRRMIETPHPLQERMTIFWHGHFAADVGGIEDGGLMLRHLRLLRRHALGSFRSLLYEIARDPALLLGLGAEANRKARPDPSFARPLLEVFTLGAGGFEEEDVREAARAFTGDFVRNGRFRHIPREHDGGEKRVLGRRGAFGGEDVLRLVLDQPATARTLVRRLYRWLISEVEEPEDSLIEPLASSLAKDWDVQRLVGTMLRSSLFFSRRAWRRRIKCPLELAVGAIRTLEGMVSTTRLSRDLAALGRDLLRPPTAWGWRGGRSWISAAAMAGRHNLARALLAGIEPYGDELDPARLAAAHGRADLRAGGLFLVELLLQSDLQPAVAESLREVARAAGSEPATALRRLAHAIVTLPEYQLA